MSPYPRLPIVLSILLFSISCAGQQNVVDMPGTASAPAPEQSSASDSAQPPARESSAEDAEISDQNARVERALREAAREGWRKLRLATGCREGGEMITAEVFGSGFGIWNGRGQYSLDEEQVREHLKLLSAAGFADFEPIYGGKPDTPRVNRRPLDLPLPGAPPRAGAMNAALVVRCRIELSLTTKGGDSTSKQVIQRVRGDSFQPFLDLADQLLELSRDAAVNASSASDLGDGLAKLADGRLAAETLRLQIQRRPPRGSGEIGWLLDIEGVNGSYRVLREQGGYTEPTAIDLERKEVASVAGELASLGLTELGSNVKTVDGYTDLRIQVLDHERQIQARGSGDATFEELNAEARQFEAIYQRLSAFYRELRSRGEQAP